MNLIKKTIYVITLLASVSCSNSRATDGAGRGDGATIAAETTPQELPLPAVPDTLRSVEERAAYVVEHYWDAMDFTDRRLSLDTAFIEQNFANFISILPVAPEAVADSAVRKLLDRSAVDPEALALITATAETYLDHPNSPMRDEETYILFLRNIIASPRLTDDEKLRPRHRLEEALKNRPGTAATDFSILLRDGSTSTLSKLLSRADATLLIFYDPDCDHCKQIIGQIAEVSFPAGVQVLAVDAEDDRDLWQQTAATLPAGWQVGFATTPILDRELYTLPASPTLYVISSEGTVIMKDANVDRALSYLAGSDPKRAASPSR